MLFLGIDPSDWNFGSLFDSPAKGPPHDPTQAESAKNAGFVAASIPRSSGTIDALEASAMVSPDPPYVVCTSLIHIC